MTEKKTTKASKVGQSVEVNEGAEVTRPDGTSTTVTGGLYVLSMPGAYVIDGEELQAK